MLHITLIKTYIQDLEKDPQADATFWNNGNADTFPNFGKEFFTGLRGTCHIGYARYFVGENSTYMPTVHFIIERTLPTTVNSANMTNGNNPAAIIHDLLINSGVKSTEIDLSSFNVAADFWNARGDGLNLIFSGQQEASATLVSCHLASDQSEIWSKRNGFATYAWLGKLSYSLDMVAQTPAGYGTTGTRSSFGYG